MQKRMVSSLLALGLLNGLFAESQAQGFDVMGFGFDSVPQAKGSATATVQTYNDKPFAIISELKLPEHWHTYYKNPGTVGLPMELTIDGAPSGFTVEGPFYQIPVKGSNGIDFYGYNGKGKIGYRVVPGADAPQEASFSVTLSWQMCAEQCASPTSETYTIRLSKGDGTPTIGAQTLEQGIPEWDVPQWGQGLQADLSQEGKEVILHLTSQKALPEGDVYFFCDRGEINPEAPQTFAKQDETHYTLTMTLNVPADDLYPNQLSPEEQKKPLSILNGILKIGEEGVLISAQPEKEIPAEVSSQHSNNEAEHSVAQIVESSDSWGLGKIMFFMFLGGIILNVMPCVFPVIGLKIMSFVQLGGGERKKVLAHSLVFVLGVMMSFWVLTAILIALKANVFSGEVGSSSLFNLDFWMGHTEALGIVNWAFWLENPWVIFALLALMTAMGLSMFGIYEIGVKATTAGSQLQQKKGFSGSFWSGALATVISTPCSAPFLGPAIGACMLQPPYGIVMCLSMMGLGMSFPYLVLGAFPGLISYLPKPGAWMESFKQAMSFLIFGTALYFLWIYMEFFDSENNPIAMLLLFFGLLVYSMAFWIYGRWCPIYRRRKTRIWGLVFFILFLVCGICLMLPPSVDESKSDSSANTNSTVTQSVWTPWSPEAMQKALDQGHPVYVDFTARWCPTCQVNKASYTSEVLEAFQHRGIVLMKADKTRPNEAIDLELKKLGRTAIPVNVLYIPGKKPIITLETLTPGYLISFLEQNLPE